MNARIVIATALALAAGLGLGYWLAGAGDQRAAEGQAPDRDAPAATAEDAREVLYWYDPMYPQHRFDAPGPSPFMDMDLVPMYAESGDVGGGVRIDPRLTQNLGMRTTTVVRDRLQRSLASVGAVAFDARLEVAVTAPVDGIVTTLWHKAPLEAVTAGTALARLLAPTWSAAQAEYRALVDANADAALREAARSRMRVLGVPDDAIRRLESGTAPPEGVVLRAPRDGVLSTVAGREGDTVTRGELLFTVQGLERVWIDTEVPEAQAGPVQPGSAAAVRVPAYPGRAFEGTVEARLPRVDPVTRTQTVRVVVDNADGALAPGMYATVRIDLPPAPEALLVPDEALIVTGERTAVVLREAGNRFRVVEVATGASHAGRTEILDGLAEGQTVVVSGQFLIDSEASLRQQVARIGGAEDAP